MYVEATKFEEMFRLHNVQRLSNRRCQEQRHVCLPLSTISTCQRMTKFTFISTRSWEVGTDWRRSHMGHCRKNSIAFACKIFHSILMDLSGNKVYWDFSLFQLSSHIPLLFGIPPIHYTYNYICRYILAYR